MLSLKHILLLASQFLSISCSHCDNFSIKKNGSSYICVKIENTNNQEPAPVTNTRRDGNSDDKTEDELGLYNYLKFKEAPPATEPEFYDTGATYKTNEPQSTVKNYNNANKRKGNPQLTKRVGSMLHQIYGKGTDSRETFTRTHIETNENDADCKKVLKFVWKDKCPEIHDKCVTCYLENNENPCTFYMCKPSKYGGTEPELMKCPINCYFDPTELTCKVITSSDIARKCNA